MRKIFIFLFLGIFISSLAFATQEVKVQVKFKEQTEVGEYSDAIYYTMEEWKKVKQSDIDVEKTKRKNNYIEKVKAPIPVYVPTQEELDEQIRLLEQQKYELETKLQELQDQELLEGSIV